MPFDTRAWNLCASAALLAGCGARTIPGQDEGPDAGSGESSDSGESPTTEDPPECVTDSDCEGPYYCIGGICEYIPHDDGHHEPYDYYECYSDSDCGDLALCVGLECMGVWTLSPCAVEQPQPTATIELGGQALALSFVDVDADGDEELVVATEAELLVRSSDGQQVASPQIAGLSLFDLAGGELDDSPGGDVLVLGPGGALLHSSNGDLSLAAPVSSPNELGLHELAIGDLDGVGPDVVLLAGEGGATLGPALGEPDIVHLEPIEHLSMLPVPAATPGFALHGAVTTIFDGAGVPTDTTFGAQGQLRAVAALSDSVDERYLVISTINGSWSLLEGWTASGSGHDFHWGVPGQVSEMVAADLDGDGQGELVLILDGAAVIVRSALDPAERCIAQLDLVSPSSPAVGDHDGDGDDDLAVVVNSGQIQIYDGL